MDVAGKRVTVMGLGRHGGGLAAARYLIDRGALVTVTDLRGAGRLRRSVRGLPGQARLHLGCHYDEDFRRADLVVVNPAVRPDNRHVQLARASGAHVTTEVELFLRVCPGRVIGVTGSNGKSTTAAMIARAVAAAGRRPWLAGNIGRSLLDRVARIAVDDVVVLELSSFQLARLPDGLRCFDVAVITNCTPNHLDWHASFDDYARAKQRILAARTADGVAVLGGSLVADGWRSLAGPLSSAPWPLEQLPRLAVPGAHNRHNAACAAAAAAAMGLSRDAIDCGLSSFGGLPHRLQFVDEVDGIRFYNDSEATTPEAAAAALEAFDAPVWLLAGGADKGCPFDDLAAGIRRRARGAAFYGATGEALFRLVAGGQAAGDANDGRWSRCRTLDAALRSCWRRARPGESIVLSPACSSFDQFADARHRGATFTSLVQILVRRATTAPMADPGHRRRGNED